MLIPCAVATLGEEGYDIEQRRANLVLTGGSTRGIINAVYALLEEDLGCRWYTATDIRLPNAKTLTVKVITG